MSYDPNQPNYTPPPPYGQPPPNYIPPPPNYGQPPSYGAPPQFYSQPKPKKSRRWLWIILAVVLIVIVGGIAAFVLAVTNSPASTVVQQYYNAVEKQDYTTAYSYLDIQTLSLNGQQQTASAPVYTQVAQAIDQADGKVTAYNITGTSLSSSTSTGNTATLTVDVTRGGKVRTVHVQLVQEDSGWKIVSIDQL